MTERTIGRYEIRDELGQGGMGTVYLGYDSTLEREVAIKVLSPQLFMQDAEFSTRFEREAKTIASLDHGSIVSLYEFGEDEEWLYFVMRFMKGGTLHDRIKSGPISLPDSISIFKRVGSALDKAHSRGIVHRDMKPGNILFDEDNEAYLSDFGIVKMDDETGIKTQTGHTLGTPQYMSPEQLDGKPLDGRSDIYSMGIILYEMLSGEKPFDDPSYAQIIVMHLTLPVPDILEKMPDLPKDVDAVIKKAMAKDPDNRYSSAGEMVEAMRLAQIEKRVYQMPKPMPKPIESSPKQEVFVKPNVMTPVRETAVPVQDLPYQPPIKNAQSSIDTPANDGNESQKKISGMHILLKIVLIFIALSICGCIGLLTLNFLIYGCFLC